MNTFLERSARIQSFSQAISQSCAASTRQAYLRSSALPLLQSRQASSASTQPSKAASQSRPSTSSSNTTTEKPQSRVNGPLSTLPAPLSVPSRQPDQSTPGYLFSIGKAYVTFYKTGGKNIWHNFKTSRPLQLRIDEHYDSSVSKAIAAGQVDRHDFQLLTRSWFDLKRVPAFALVFAICGEFTPLVVIAVTSIVPYTCRIPKQINGDRTKLEKRRKISFRNLTSSLPADSKTNTDVKVVERLERMQLIHISWSLGLSSSIWDYLGGQFPGLPTFILRRKVRRRVEYLEIDDSLIAKQGGLKDMSSEEVKIAAVERGIDVAGKPEKAVRSDLEDWLKARKLGASVERLLLSRPTVWDVTKGSD